jgi:hypothetical protein
LSQRVADIKVRNSLGNGRSHGVCGEFLSALLD